MTFSARVLDPVCGMLIEPGRAIASREHRGETYHLCSEGCLLKFDADADAYIAATRLDEYRTWVTDEHPRMESSPET